MRRHWLIIIGSIFCATSVVAWTPVFNVDNTASTRPEISYFLDCDASWSNDAWTSGPIDHGRYATISVPNWEDKFARGYGCSLEIYGQHHIDYYNFYYSVAKYGGFDDGPGIVTVNADAPGITFCPHYDYTDFRINQGSNQRVTTNYSTEMHWKSTVNYSWVQGKKIAHAIAARIEAAYSDEYTVTCIGNYNVHDHEFEFYLTFVHVQEPEPIPEGCYYFPPGYAGTWPAGYSHPDNH